MRESSFWHVVPDIAGCIAAVQVTEFRAGLYEQVPRWWLWMEREYYITAATLRGRMFGLA